jgi:hypothetical protein
VGITGKLVDERTTEVDGHIGDGYEEDIHCSDRTWSGLLGGNEVCRRSHRGGM